MGVQHESDSGNAGAVSTPNDELDLFWLWDILWGGRWLLVLSALLGFVASAAIAWQMAPVYEARVTMIRSDEGASAGALSGLGAQFGGIASLAGINLGGKGGKSAAAVAILNSHAFTVRFIEQNGLLPLLFADQWDAETGQWQAEPPSLNKAARLFKARRTVVDDLATGTVTLNLSWTDAELAARWANGLIAMLNQTVRDQDVAEAQRALEFLKQKVNETSNIDMQETIYRLIESQTKTIMLANVRDDYVFQIVDPAYPPEHKSRPKRALIAILGGFLGGVAGTLLIFGRLVVRRYQARGQAGV